MFKRAIPTCIIIIIAALTAIQPVSMLIDMKFNLGKMVAFVIGLALTASIYYLGKRLGW